MPAPYTLRIFLPHGEPDGVRVVTKAGWIGTALVIPRPLLAKTKNREEFARPGVYLLTGPSESGELPRVYIGEGSPVRPRLESHLVQKDFWTQCIFFTASDGSLNKAHIQQLEARLVQLAQRAKRCDLENGNVPTPPLINEAELADSENFLREALSILPLLGVSVFDDAPAPRPPTPESAIEAPHPSAPVELHLVGKGVTATGYESNAGFVVRAGSQAVCDRAATETCPDLVTSLRAELRKLGVLRPVEAAAPEASPLVFTQDYEFNSPSLAAANGRVYWKDAEGHTLKELQDAAADA